MPLWYNKALNLTEREIRYAMRNLQSNAGAARFLGCDIKTYRKYAKMYIDDETGDTLWNVHLNQSGKGLAKRASKPMADIFDILAGKHPNYDKKKLERRLLDERILEYECENCGHSEIRLTDGKAPLLLTWKDGNYENHMRDNLCFLCYNCTFLYQGGITFRRIHT